MTVHTDMQAYYAARASTYDDIYAGPERQADLAILHQRVRALFAGQRVLEIACGTGYWSTDIAATAEQLLATDINPEVIALARARHLPADKVSFEIADAFALAPGAACNACFAGFWWSHVARQQQTGFLDQLRQRLGAEARLVMIDNTYVEGSSTPIARTDAHGNTYQIRRLANNQRYEVLKNFPTDSGLRKRLAGHLKDIRIERLEYYWVLNARLR
jgi:SAM-dependent methyltransferase